MPLKLRIIITFNCSFKSLNACQIDFAQHYQLLYHCMLPIIALGVIFMMKMLTHFKLETIFVGG